MTTLQEKWRNYRDTVYPKGIPARQNLECHQAFFAGCLVALNAASALSDLPEDQAVKELEKLFAETREIIRARVSTLKQQN